MALRDFIVMGAVPINYLPSGRRIQNHIEAIDTNLVTVTATSAGGRPGDEDAKAPSVSELTTAGLEDAIAYWTLNFDDTSSIPSSDSDYDMITSSVAADNYAPYVPINSKSSLSVPVGAVFVHIGARPYTAAHVPALALSGDMTFLCMSRNWLPSTHRHCMVDYGSINSGTNTGATLRVPYRYTLTEWDAASASVAKDRVINYSHFTAADAEVLASPIIDASTQNKGLGIAASIPSGIYEMGHGFTRAVGATTDINFYVNGLNIGSATGLVNPGTAGSSTDMRLHIGSEHFSNQSYGGSLRSVGIWDRVLSVTEINNFYELCIGKQ